MGEEASQPQELKTLLECAWAGAQAAKTSLYRGEAKHPYSPSLKGFLPEQVNLGSPL